MKRLEFECVKKCGIYEVEVDWFSQFLTKWLTFKVGIELKSDTVTGARITFNDGCPKCKKDVVKNSGRVQIIKLARKIIKSKEVSRN